MSQAAPGNQPPAADGETPPRRRGRILIPTIAVVLALILLFVIFTGFYTDLLWFRSIGKSSVFTRQLGIRVGLFLVFGFGMAFCIGLSIVAAYRTRPKRKMRTPEQISLERYRAALEPMRRPLAFVVPIVIGLLAGISASSEWRTWSMWRNQTPFGQKDAQFGIDIGFYTFTYPWLRFLLGFLFALVLLALITSLIVQYLYGGIRLQSQGKRVSDAAATQISIILGIFCLLKAAGYWLDRYGLAVKSETLVQGFTGLKYRDLHALLPAKTILCAIAIICALLFFVNAFRRSWTLAGAGLGLLVASALVIGGVYPGIVQQFQVKPSELTKEAPAIQRNIDATRSAYGLTNVKVQDYNASPTPDRATLATQSGTLNNVRIVDPSVVSPTFRALQQIRSYYSFPNALDIDRYPLQAKTQGAVVSVRDVNLDGVPDSQRNWANDHLVYTHGYGFVAAFDNQKQPNGTPVFFESNIPPTGALYIAQPRVYFGEDSPEYSIVGGGPGATPRELDYPDDAEANGQKNNTYDGKGGVPVGSPFNRLLFATKYQEPNILLSGLINPDSKILWDRDPLTEVGKAAPWLKLDADPYPVVVDGRMKWIVDAYTTSNDYPYSSRVALSDAVGDAGVKAVGTGTSGPRDEINYIRNSVKAVVDAYDGTVDLYGWDPTDPILQTWEKVFPGVVQPKSAMAPSILEHVRYPEDGFAIQRLIFSRYHVTDAAAFYSGQDFWIVPTDPTKKQSNLYQPPYYLSLQQPGSPVTNFSLTTTYAPIKRQTLAAFMSVNSDAGPNFGQFQVLQLPRNTTIPGPAQVQNNFESDAIVAPQLSLLRKGGSEVDLGNLLSLPVGGGILYVEPVYVRASQDGYPLLQKILVGFGDKVAMEDTLAAGLAKVGLAPVIGPTPGPNPKPGPAPKTSAIARLAAALDDAQNAYNDGQAALKAGDFAAYGKAQKRLQEALARAQAAQQELSKNKGSAAAVTPASLAAIKPD